MPNSPSKMRTSGTLVEDPLLNPQRVTELLLYRLARRRCCVFRRIVTARFGIVTAEFGSVTEHFGDVTDGRMAPA